MVSFDVFDTLITRDTATPDGVFALMQQELFINAKYQEIARDLRENFASIRIHAERMARACIQKAGIEDVTFEEIYEYFSLRGNITRDQRELLMRLEIDTEYQVSRGISENIERIKKLSDQGERVVLISDMYLPKEVIRTLLVKADRIFETIPLYVSNEYRKIKFTTNLFQVVKSKEKISYAEWKHIGDNERGDYQGPEKLGIMTERYAYPQLLEMEKRLLDCDRYDWKVQLTIGASRNARIGKTGDINYAIGTAVGAPLLVQYVEWIIEQALKRKLTRLYFIARDGFILKEIADIVLERMDSNIETQYIYGSRKAWRMPSICENNRDVEELLNWSHINSLTTFQKIADVFQIEEWELKQFIPEEYRNIEKISSISRRKIISYLNCDDFVNFLIQKHESKRNLTVEYLKQNIDTDDDNFAFVELAGSGYTQICLAHIMQEFYQGSIKSFYFKMDKLQEKKECEFFVFFPSKFQQHIMIEVLCHAPHGQTRGYLEKNGEIIPDIERYEEPELQAHGIENYVEGVKRFTAEKYRDDRLMFSMKLSYIEKIYQYLIKTPDREILDFIGDMPNSVTGRENKVITYAPRLSKKDILNLFFYRTYEPIEEFYKGTSLECSLMRCTDKEKKLIDRCERNHGKWTGSIYRLKKGIHSDNSGVIPWELLGKRVAIYAAGHFGQICYETIKKSRKHSVVLWVDQQWEAKRECGLKVDPVDRILETEFDHILVAIENEKISKEIMDKLIGMGISENKIVTI